MRDCEIEAMIRALRRIEAEECLSMKGMAQKLGFSAGHLSMIYAGKRRPGIRFVRAVMERFPEIRHMIAESLRTPSQEDRRERGPEHDRE
jgi:hypothetical protein